MPEERFLQACLSYLLDGNSPRPTAPGEMDWEKLYSLVVRHKLSGLAYLLGREGPQPWPDFLQQRFQRDYYSARLWGDQCRHEVSRALAALRDAGVRLLVLKGWALIPAVYKGDTGCRVFADIDLLVSPAQAGTAERVLEGLGYRALPEVWPGFGRRYENGRSFQLPGEPGPFGTVLAIGLHWHLLILPFYFRRVPVAGLFEQARPLEVAGEPVEALAPEDNLVYTCGHLGLHHLYDPALFRAYEMAAAIRQAGASLDWKLVLERVTGWELVLPVQRTLGWLSRLFPGLVPDPVLEQVQSLAPSRAERRVHTWMLRGRDNHAIRWMIAWFTLEWWKRPGFVLETAVPSPAYMKQRYCPQRPALWPLAYLWRAGIGLAYALGYLRVAA